MRAIVDAQHGCVVVLVQRDGAKETYIEVMRDALRLAGAFLDELLWVVNVRQLGRGGAEIEIAKANPGQDIQNVLNRVNDIIPRVLS